MFFTAPPPCLALPLASMTSEAQLLEDVAALDLRVPPLASVGGSSTNTNMTATVSSFSSASLLASAAPVVVTHVSELSSTEGQAAAAANHRTTTAGVAGMTSPPPPLSTAVPSATTFRRGTIGLTFGSPGRPGADERKMEVGDEFKGDLQQFHA